MNIVKMIMDLFGGSLLGKFGSMFGLGESQAKGAVSAAVPAMLSALMAKSKEPGGAAEIDRAIDSVHSQSLGDIGAALSGDGGAMADKGSSLLSGLLGDGMLSSLTGGLGKFLGMGGSSIASMLGLIGPMVLGALGKAKDTTGMSVSNLLASQKDNIVSALPSGLGNMLKSVPGLGSVMAAAPAVAPAAAYATKAAANGIGRVLVPLCLLGAVLLGALWYFNRDHGTSTVSAPNVPVPSVSKSNFQDDTTATLASAKISDASTLTADLGTSLSKVTKSLEGITDSASAQAALPKLKESLTSIDSLQELAAKLPESARSPIASAIDSARPGLKTAIDKVLAIPGVGDTLKPTTDALLLKLDKLAGK